MNRGEIISNVALYSYGAYLIHDMPHHWKAVIGLFIFASALNTCLKYAVHRLIRGHYITCRPLQECYHINHPQDIGMPSGHAQTMFTLLGFFQPTQSWHYILGLIVMIGRVDGLRHTWLQVVVGAIIGYLSGRLLHNLFKNLRNKSQ
jgi:membrane-associated phospholipid phosphatase